MARRSIVQGEGGVRARHPQGRRYIPEREPRHWKGLVWDRRCRWLIEGDGSVWPGPSTVDTSSVFEYSQTGGRAYAQTPESIVEGVQSSAADKEGRRVENGDLFCYFDGRVLCSSHQPVYGTAVVNAAESDHEPIPPLRQSTISCSMMIWPPVPISFISGSHAAVSKTTQPNLWTPCLTLPAFMGGVCHMRAVWRGVTDSAVPDHQLLIYCQYLAAAGYASSDSWPLAPIVDLNTYVRCSIMSPCPFGR